MSKRLNKQNYKAIRYAITLFCLLTLSSFSLIFLDNEIISIIAVITIFSLWIYIYYQFNKYLLNFQLYSNVRAYVNGMIVGEIIMGFGFLILVLPFGWEGLNIPVFIIILGFILWGVCRYVVSRRLTEDVEDFVGGISDADQTMGGLGTPTKFLMIFMLYNIYQTFLFADYHSSQYGFRDEASSLNV